MIFPRKVATSALDATRQRTGVLVWRWRQSRRHGPLLPVNRHRPADFIFPMAATVIPPPRIPRPADLPIPLRHFRPFFDFPIPSILRSKPRKFTRRYFACVSPVFVSQARSVRHRPISTALRDRHRARRSERRNPRCAFPRR